mgnify:CR=1 FL=1
MKIEKIIVTGHRGFIGTNFINLLSHKNYEYYGIDALYKGANKFNTDGLKNIKKEYNFCLSSDELYKNLESDFQDFNNTLVVHFAAYSHVDDSIKNPIELVDINIKSTHKLARFCAEKNIPFILISTDEVLGSLRDNELPSDINEILKPRNPYSFSKASCEMLIHSLQCQYPNWHVYITRCVNNFGEYQDPTKLIPVCINKILNNEKIPIYGQGLQRRSWIPVYIHNQIILNIIEKEFNCNNYIKFNHYNIYHIGSKIELSNIDMIYKICQLMNVNPLEHIQYIKDPRGYAHDYRYSLSYKETLLSFGKDCLDFDLDNMLQLTIDFYKNNKNKEMWI